MEVARHLHELPGVILDTKERLYLTTPEVEETVLPPAPGQAFQFRYRRLRLLVQGRDRLFLVPEKWSASNSTLVVARIGVSETDRVASVSQSRGRSRLSKEGGVGVEAPIATPRQSRRRGKPSKEYILTSIRSCLALLSPGL